MKGNIMFTLLTCNTWMCMYSATTLSYYVKSYNNFSFRASTPRTRSHRSFLLSLSIHFIVDSILWSHTLLSTTQTQERWTDIYSSCHPDLDVSGQKTSWKSISSLHISLWESEVYILLLLYANASPISWPVLTNLSLADSLSPRDTCQSGVCERAYSHHGQPEFGSRLFPTQVTDLKRCTDICNFCQ